MKNKKTWLVIKGCLILVFAIYVMTSPTNDNFRKWLRMGMLVFFVISFLIDVNNFKKDNT